MALRDYFIFPDDLTEAESAAVVTPITGFNSPARGPQAVGDGNPGPKTQEIRRHLVDIQFGRAEDPFGWTRRVC